MKNRDFFNRGRLIQYFPYILILLVVTVPLWNDFLSVIGGGHDIYFHLMRLEGLAEGIRTGQFPVKIQPAWYEGYGYACSVFYGDLFLYFPAFLRNLGVPLQTSFKLYIVFINVLTIMITNYSAYGIFKSNKASLIASGVYTLSIYRLTNIYVRSAVGEYTAMAFLPLIIYALYLLLGDEPNKKTLRKGYVLLSIALTAVLQSHILSFEILIIVIGFVCIICFKRVMKSMVFLSFIKAMILTSLLNMGFLVPFVDYMITGKYNVNAINGGVRIEQKIQDSGAFFSQLFNLFYEANGTNLLREAGTAGEMPIGIGLGLAASLLVFLYLSLKTNEMVKKTSIFKVATICAFIGLSTLFMSTCHFPWDFIRNLGRIPRYIVINIQFPWRFLTIASVSLSFLSAALVSLWENSILCEKEKAAYKWVGIILIGVTIFSAIYLLENVTDQGNTIRVKYREDMNTMVKSGEEYIPINTITGNLKRENLIIEEGLQITNYTEVGVEVRFLCDNKMNKEKVLEFPRIYYKGYQVYYTSESGKEGKLETYAGDNNVVRVVIPANFKGEIILNFKSLWYWRVAELLSVLVFISLIIHIIYLRNQNNLYLKQKEREKIV